MYVVARSAYCKMNHHVNSTRYSIWEKTEKEAHKKKSFKELEKKVNPDATHILLETKDTDINYDVNMD